MPHRKIHSNDVATVAAEVKGDGAHHRAAEGGRQPDGQALPAGVEEKDEKRVQLIEEYMGLTG